MKLSFGILCAVSITSQAWAQFGGFGFWQTTVSEGFVSFSEEEKLTASDAAGADQFGLVLGIDGDTVIVSSYFDDDNGGQSGSAYIFTRSGSTWSQQQKLTASDAAGSDRFGEGVAVSGDTAVVGAPREDENGSQSGSAYIFTRSGSTWTQQQKLITSDGVGSDRFSESVAIDGDTVVGGAHLDDDDGTSSGSAYVFVQ